LEGEIRSTCTTQEWRERKRERKRERDVGCAVVVVRAFRVKEEFRNIRKVGWAQGCV
jgi:hypothetical protein